jgi:hypothetical protein
MKKDRWLRRKHKQEKKAQRRLRFAKRGNSKPGDYTYRAGWKDRHHITNKVFGGTMSPHNLLLMDRHRHNAWHLLFKNMSFLDVVYLLLRVLRIKGHADYPESESILETYLDEVEDGKGNIDTDV